MFSEAFSLDDGDSYDTGMYHYGHELYKDLASVRAEEEDSLAREEALALQKQQLQKRNRRRSVNGGGGMDGDESEQEKWLRRIFSTRPQQLWGASAQSAEAQIVRSAWELDWKRMQLSLGYEALSHRCRDADDKTAIRAVLHHKYPTLAALYDHYRVVCSSTAKGSAGKHARFRFDDQSLDTLLKDLKVPTGSIQARLRREYSALVVDRVALESTMPKSAGNVPKVSVRCWKHAVGVLCANGKVVSSDLLWLCWIAGCGSSSVRPRKSQSSFSFESRRLNCVSRKCSTLSVHVCVLAISFSR